jgi:hypothetical protein
MLVYVNIPADLHDIFCGIEKKYKTFGPTLKKDKNVKKKGEILNCVKKSKLRKNHYFFQYLPFKLDMCLLIHAKKSIEKCFHLF